VAVGVGMGVIISSGVMVSEISESAAGCGAGISSVTGAVVIGRKNEARTPIKTPNSNNAIKVRTVFALEELGFVGTGITWVVVVTCGAVSITGAAV